jgi:hypothetical protein
MPKYVIERDIPGIQKMSPRDLQAISLKSRNVLESIGPQIQWQHSYVTDDKLFCVYVAPNEEMIHEHARKGNIPLSRISEVRSVIDPTTADGYIFGRQG